MVNSVLKKLLLTLLSCSAFLLSYQNAIAAVSDPEIPLFKEYQGKVYVTTKPTKVVLGEKITLTIRGESLNQSFEKIDWSEFKRHFVIYDVDIGFDRIKVQLYPIDSGLFTMKGQKAGVIKLPNIEIEVSPNPEVSIEWHRPSANLYVHQNATWKALVTLKNIANKASYELRQGKLNQAVISRLQTLPVHTIENSAGKTDTLVASYEIKGLASSKPANSIPTNSISKGVVLHSPVITVKNTSNRRWHFFDKAQAVYLNPLPSFLPMTVAVGEIDWSSTPTNLLQATGELNYWSWQLTGKGLTKAYLNSVAHQLVSQIRHDPAIEWLSDSREIQTEYTTEGLQSSLKLRLPYRITQAGLAELPALQLPYFNPETGMLITKTQPATTLFAIPVWLIWLAQWLLLLLGLLVSFLTLMSLKQARLNLQLRGQIKRAKDVQTLWQALYQWRCQQQAGWLKGKPNRTAPKTTAEAPIENCAIHSQTTGQWVNWYQNQLDHSTLFNQFMTALDRMLYAPPDRQDQSDEWPALQQQALEWANSLNWWSKPLKTLSLFKRKLPK